MFHVIVAVAFLLTVVAVSIAELVIYSREGSPRLPYTYLARFALVYGVFAAGAVYILLPYFVR